MKHLILISLSIITGFSLYSQSAKEKKLSSQAGGNNVEISSNSPRAFLTVFNSNFTFIKDSLNHLMAVSHGYDDTRLECHNCQIIQEDNLIDYLVYTPNPGECTISIYGINVKTKKEACLAKYTFQIADSIYHDIYLDKILSGNSITSKIKTINCKNRDYWSWEEGDIELMRWKMIHGNNEITGTGNELNKEARKFINDVPNGEAVVVIVNAKSNFQKPFVTRGVFFKND